MKQQLLCTFTYLDNIPTSIGQIYKTYTVDGVTNIKCYSYVESPTNVICVYNVNFNETRLKDTISINRRKESNTFYSINALNSLICTLNNGILDKSFTVDWQNYVDILLLADRVTGHKQVKIKELSH